MKSYVVLLGASLVLSSCLFDSTEEPTTIFEQLPYAQALLNANGLSHLKADSLSKVYNPGDPHSQEWYLDLSGQDITTFDFTSDVKKLTLYVAIDLRNNQIAAVPKNLTLKAWKQIMLDTNKLCGLTTEESSSLDAAKAMWRGTQDCTE